MRLVVVVFKGNRTKVDCKYAGGLLNPGKAYYVQRTQGNRNPFNGLCAERVKLERKQHVPM